jgi:alpha-beta hydrolase superfamily lysophospholipase
MQPWPITVPKIVKKPDLLGLSHSLKGLLRAKPDRSLEMRKNQMRQTLMYLILTALCIYIGLAVFLFLFQSRLMYFPDRGLISTPHEIGARYEAITFQTEDRVDLSAWFVPADDSKGVILFCHGNAGNISHRIGYLEVFLRLGLSTFIFDYRGFGTSDGVPTEQGTYLDAKAAWKYLVEKRGVPPDRIVIFGESMGGAVAAWLAQTNRPAALILQSTFTSVPDLASRLYPFVPARWIVRYGYNTREYIGRVDCPVLIVHSCEDEIVPYSHGCELYDLVKGPKEFFELRGDHNSGFMITVGDYSLALGRFIEKYIGK